MIDLLRIVLPMIAVLLVILASLTALTSLGPALIPLAVVAALAIAIWLWKPPR